MLQWNKLIVFWILFYISVSVPQFNINKQNDFPSYNKKGSFQFFINFSQSLAPNSLFKHHNISYSDLLKSVDAATAEKFNLSKIGIDSNLIFNNFDTLILKREAFNNNLLLLQDTIKISLAIMLKDIKKTISPESKIFLIKGISYIASGTYKDILKIEVETDSGMLSFGWRLINGEKYREMENKWMAEQFKKSDEKIIQETKILIDNEVKETQKFKEWEKLVIKFYNAYYLDNPQFQTIINDLKRLNIWGFILGDFFEGQSIHTIRNKDDKIRAYLRAIETVVETWLNSIEIEDEDLEIRGTMVTDLNGSNFLQQTSNPDKSEVLYSDVGKTSQVTFNSLLETIQLMVKNELKIEPFDIEFRRFLNIIENVLGEIIDQFDDNKINKIKKSAVFQGFDDELLTFLGMTLDEERDLRKEFKESLIKMIEYRRSKINTNRTRTSA
ncbi:MAG: hypothetical protein ACD_79C00264G0001 [uncultured bacterium]|nr:MAG: hypothetical protein ACD_79C00264G0001 [uncultured bacterium]